MRRAAGLLLFVALSAHAHYVPRSEVTAAAQAAAAEAKAYTQAPDLVGAIRQAQLEANSDPLRAEARLQQLLLRLRDAPAQARVEIEALLDYSPRVYTDAIDPEHRGRTVPAFEIAGSARAVLRHWDARTAKATYRDALARADFAALRSAADSRTLAALIDEADAAGLALLQQAALPQPAARVALFERSGDAALIRELLREPADAASRQLPTRIAERLAAPDALALLADTEIHETRRSAARLAIGSLASTHAPARQFLLDTLGDAQGASSATALARSLDDTTLAAIDSVLADGRDNRRTRHALLVLHLSGDARADARLRAYARDAAQPATLREEVRAWLR